MGKNHTIALDTKGRVFSWGRGTLSWLKLAKMFYPSTLALGHDEGKNLYQPKPIKALWGINIKKISSGNDFAMALDDKSNVYVWGWGEFGVLGFINKE